MDYLRENISNCKGASLGRQTQKTAIAFFVGKTFIGFGRINVIVIPT
jgi:hypothetical protein